jgi:hypothetical protein
MTTGRSLARRLVSLTVVALAATRFALFAAGSPAPMHANPILPGPSPAPGVYPNPILVSVPVPEGKRLEISVNGSAFADYSGPVLLAAAAGEERDFAVETRLFALSPGSSPESGGSWHWRIDRKPPLPPVLSVSQEDGGYAVSPALSEPGLVRYRMWHPAAHATASGTLASGERLFLPEGASLVAYAVDEAGNASDPVSPDRARARIGDSPFRVVNPVPGTWANRQTLVIESASGTELRYSLDGSDPVLSGLAYDGPILLDKTGLVTLRVVAVDASGKRYPTQILYTVQADGTHPPEGFSDTAPNPSSGEFAEITIPEEITWSFGDFTPSNPGGKTIAIAAVRGAVIRYPLVLSDGAHLWRYVAESGSPAQIAPSAGTAATSTAVTPEDTIAAPAASAGLEALAPQGDATAQPSAAPPASPAVPAASSVTVPTVKVCDWNFVALGYKDPLYWSIDGSAWHAYTEPVFIDRSRDAVLSWYSASWKSGAAQTLRLPAKPAIVGVRQGDVTAKPVFLSVEKSAMRFRYTVGSDFYPMAPDSSSPELASGLLVELPAGAESRVTVRLQAEYEGIVQGELATDFTVDRRSPRDPATGLEAQPPWSRVPVRFLPVGEDTTELTIDPPIYSRVGRDWVLDGVPGKAIDYTVKAVSVDRAGNRSGLKTTCVTVELNTAYVGSAASSGDQPLSAVHEPDGSPAAPFASLDDALALARSGTWRLIVRGSVPLDHACPITGSVSIDGQGASIVASGEGSIAVEGGDLEINGCSIKKTNTAVEASPLVNSARPGSLIEVKNGLFRSRGITVSMEGGETACVIRATASRVDCESSRLELAAREYAECIDATDSSLSLDSLIVSCSAHTVSGLALTGSRAEIKASTLSVIPALAGRAIEAWASRVTLADVTLERKDASSGDGSAKGRARSGEDEIKNRDTAFWLDAKSRVLAETGVVARGFWRARETGAR